jgi:hypothetical protein
LGGAGGCKSYSGQLTYNKMLGLFRAAQCATLTKGNIEIMCSCLGVFNICAGDRIVSGGRKYLYRVFQKELYNFESV